MYAIIGIIILAFECVAFGLLGVWRFNIPLTLAAAGSFAYWLLSLTLVGITFIAWFCRTKRTSIVLVVLYPILFLLGVFLSSHLLNAEKYYHQLEVPEATAFQESDLPPFDPLQLPWVDESQANVLGDKVLGRLGAIGSSVVIGEYTRQEVAGKLYMVAPILHKDFFAYSRNKEGTPGYIMVSMTSSDDVRLVTDIGGKNLHIRVQPEGHAAWGDKLERIVYRKYPFSLTSDWMFEIDNELHPYWIVPIYENTIIWGGAEVRSIVVVDAVTGEQECYSPEDAPLWIDRIQPVTFIERQLSSWGAYGGGYWNTLFGKIGLLQSDPGNAMVYRDGECYLFDSLTSYNGADESTVGFVLVNLRTKKVQHFNLAGATEEAAQLSALGDERVKHLLYKASFPLPTMLEGQPAFFFALKDPRSRITKMFALVNIAKHQLVGIGNTIQSAKLDYLSKLRTSGQSPLNTSWADLREVSGTVLRWGQYVQNGETYYRFILDRMPDRLFVAGSSFSEVPITRAGDRIMIRVMETDESIWSVLFFDNLEFAQKQSALEEALAANPL